MKSLNVQPEFQLFQLIWWSHKKYNNCKDISYCMTKKTSNSMKTYCRVCYHVGDLHMQQWDDSLLFCWFNLMSNGSTIQHKANSLLPVITHTGCYYEVLLFTTGERGCPVCVSHTTEAVPCVSHPDLLHSRRQPWRSVIDDCSVITLSESDVTGRRSSEGKNVDITHPWLWNNNVHP